MTRTVTARLGVTKDNTDATPGQFAADLQATLDTFDAAVWRWRGAWSSATAYAANDVVITSGTSSGIWIALAASTNVAPGTDSTIWQLFRTPSATGYANLAALPAAASGNAGELQRTTDGGVYESDGSQWQVIRNRGVRVTDPGYGAVGDGVHDDSAAIQAAINAAGERGKVEFEDGKTFLLNSPIVGSYERQNWFLYGAKLLIGHTGIGVTIGQTGTRTRHVRLHGGRILRNGGHDWTAGSVAIQFLNTNYCHWYEGTVGEASVNTDKAGVETGVLYRATAGQGTSYCELHSPLLTSCKFPLSFLADGAGAFVNENHVYGGRLGYESTGPSAVGGYNVKIDFVNGATLPPNNNKLIGTTLEGAIVAAGNPTGAIYDNGDLNMFMNCRYEGLGWTVPFIVQGPGQTEGGNVYAYGDGLVGPSVVSLNKTRATILGENGRYMGGGSAIDPIILTLRQSSSNTNKFVSYLNTAGVEVYYIDGNGNIVAALAGAGYLVKEGSNAKMGVATLVGGTVTVSTTKVTASSRIQLTTQALGTVTAPKAIAVTARTAGTSFTITSADATDTSTVAWLIMEPA
jgi:hypothetical protein